MDSILLSIKKMLGIAADYKHFDEDIIMHINSVFMTLNQLGINESVPCILGEDETWDSVFGDIKNIPAIKTYTYLKVRMVFDPPTSAFVMEAMKTQATELEWRLNVQADN